MKTEVEKELTSDLDSWSGKMCPVRSRQTAAKTSVRSSKKQSGSQTKMPLFLDLRMGGAGIHQAASWETDTPLLGVYLTHSFGESPSVAVESHLSQILVVQAHPKYSLSAKACRGILRRAERREKVLPTILRIALESQIVAESQVK